jgi:hypothetical protein
MRVESPGKAERSDGPAAVVTDVAADGTHPRTGLV